MGKNRSQFALYEVCFKFVVPLKAVDLTLKGTFDT